MTNTKDLKDIEEFLLDSKFIARQLVNEHEEIKKFTAGFGKPMICNCKGCEIARKLLGDVNTRFYAPKKSLIGR